MESKEMLEALAENIYIETGISKDLVTMDTELQDLDIDSLSFITILVSTEDSLGVSLIGTEAEQATTIREIVEIIKKQTKDN